jgi:hypothetical protein
MDGCKWWRMEACGLFQGTILSFTWGTEENMKTLRIASFQTDSWAQELLNLKQESCSINHNVQLFSFLLYVVVYELQICYIYGMKGIIMPQFKSCYFENSIFLYC